MAQHHAVTFRSPPDTICLDDLDREAQTQTHTVTATTVLNEPFVVWAAAWAEVASYCTAWGFHLPPTIEIGAR